jgi:catechol 2,3-dioxygenase-like lactoylglutathione lyase family enzyme
MRDLWACPEQLTQQPTGGSMWQINRLDHVVLWVRDLDRSLAFYRALGFEVDEASLAIYDAGERPFVKVKAGPYSAIDLRPDPAWEPLPRGQGNMQHLNVVLEGVDDIRTVVARLAEQGLKPDVAPHVQGNAWGFDIFDPDNNRIELRLAVPAEPPIATKQAGASHSA